MGTADNRRESLDASSEHARQPHTGAEHLRLNASVSGALRGTEGSNLASSTGESSANHRQGLGRGCRTLARGVSFCTRGGLGASHAPIYDTFNVQPRLISRPDPRPARAKVREAVLTVAGGVKQVSFVSA